jgi:hypothetical protein
VTGEKTALNSRTPGEAAYHGDHHGPVIPTNTLDKDGAYPYPRADEDEGKDRGGDSKDKNLGAIVDIRLVSSPERSSRGHR